MIRIHDKKGSYTINFDEFQVPCCCMPPLCASQIRALLIAANHGVSPESATCCFCADTAPVPHQHADVLRPGWWPTWIPTACSRIHVRNPPNPISIFVPEPVISNSMPGTPVADKAKEACCAYRGGIR